MALIFPAPAQIKNLLDPTANTDAATKQYVDNALGSGATITVANVVATSNVSANIVTSNTITSSGNLSAANISGGNLIVANYISGNGSLLSSIAGANVTGVVANANYAAYAGNITIASQPNITSVGTLTSLAVTGNISSGNANLGNLVVGNYFSGTSLTITGNISSGNANLGNLVVGNYFSGNGSLLTSLTGANVTGQVGNALIAGTVYTNAQPNITSVGTLTSLSVSGTFNSSNLSSNNANLGNLTTTYITSNLIPSSNVTYNLGNSTNRWKDLWLSGSTVYLADGTLSAGTMSLGNSNVSIPSSNGNVTISVTGVANVVVVTSTGINIAGTLNATGSITGSDASLGNTVSANYFTGTLTTSAQPNITSVGRLINTTLGASNSFTGGNLVSANYLAGTITTASQPNITTVGTLSGLLVQGNTTITGNLTVTGTTITVNSNNVAYTDSLIELHTYANLAPLTSDDGKDVGIHVHYFKSIDKHAFFGFSNDSLAFEYYVDGIETSGTFSGTYGDFKGSRFISTATTGTAPFVVNSTTEVGGLNAQYANIVTGHTQSNITTVGTLTTLQVAGNLTTGTGSGGNISGVNYIVANYFVGNGSLLSNISAVTAGTVTTNAQPNITSVGTLTGLTINGTTSLGSVGNVHITGGSSGQYLQTDGSGTLSWVSASTLDGVVDEFTGDGSKVDFTLSTIPSSKRVTFAVVQGVMQPKSSYSVTGAVLTFSSAPPNGALVEVTTMKLG